MVASARRRSEDRQPDQFVWSTIDNFKIEGNRITADVKSFDPTLFKWMAFLTGYVLPKAYYEKVGAEGFEKKPIGTGPFMVDAYEGNAFLRLKANPNYWGGKPAFETVVFKFVPDGTSRVAEIESGSSDVTLEIPYEEYDRLRQKSGLAGVCKPISDIGMIFITNVDATMLDKNVRLAACHAVDKAAIVKRLLRGYGVPIDTLQAPEYEAYDPSIKVPYDPALAKKLLAASGYSVEKPVKFKIQTTRGFKPKDYEMIQAIVGMWRKVGIEAEIEVYEIAKHYELRAAHKLAPMAFYNLGRRDRRSGDLDRLRDLRPLAPLGLEVEGPRRHDRPLVGREGRGEAHRRLEGRRQVHRRRGLRAAAPAIYAADRVQGRPQGHPEHLGGLAADVGLEGVRGDASPAFAPTSPHALRPTLPCQGEGRRAAAGWGERRGHDPSFAKP